MEQTKTLEELQAENSNLVKQLEDINTKVKELSLLLLDAKEYNVKLAYSIRLFAETHLTRDEKLAIAQEFDRAVNAEQVEKIYQKYINQICPPGVEIENDFMWSPGFIRDIEKYYFHHKGFNPFEIIDNHAKIVRNQFQIEESLRMTDNPEQIKVLKEKWQLSREASSAAIDDILLITNEILKK